MAGVVSYDEAINIIKATWRCGRELARKTLNGVKAGNPFKTACGSMLYWRSDARYELLPN